MKSIRSTSRWRLPLAAGSAAEPSRLRGRLLAVRIQAMLLYDGGHPGFQVPEGNIYDFQSLEFNRRGCREDSLRIVSIISAA